MKKENIGLLLGGIGVICFSLTLLATNVAVPYFGTTVVGLGRTIIAAFIVAIIFIIRKEKLPSRTHFKSIVIVALGAILAFPLLTSWAMKSLPVSHGAIEVALLPLATAGMAAIRAGERPSSRFWIASLVGATSVILYASQLGINGFQFEDLGLLAAVLILGLSYAEGGKLSREIGSWQVIAWAILIATPFFIIPVALQFSERMLQAPLEAWMSLLYLSIVSQFLAYVAWYGGMALGGISRVSQLQYLQPFLMIIFAFLLLGESIHGFTIMTAIIVVFAVFIGKGAKIKQKQASLLKDEKLISNE